MRATGDHRDGLARSMWLKFGKNPVNNPINGRNEQAWKTKLMLV
jgi:hypothetical protein